MENLYGIYHEYEVDGGFGDAVSQEDLLFVTDSYEVADSYAKAWSNNHIYDCPYAELHQGLLTVRTLPFKRIAITKDDILTPPWKLGNHPSSMYLEEIFDKDFFKRLEEEDIK